jgi:GTP-binding protein
MARRAGPPIVAIVGRPNVGKSRLFNRLAGHGRALVDDAPGITRDRIAEDVELGGRHILLVDTAGLDPEPAGDLAGAVQAQAQEAVDSADAILFVVDGKAGLLPEDEAIARTLRRTRKPLVLVVNKIDVPAHQARVGEFHRLGLEPVHAVSAEHGTGAFEALEALSEALPPGPPQEESGAETGAGAVRIALVGRPNVGKSSLLNALLGEERAVVSTVPGTTRDAVDIAVAREGRRYVLVDTAGLRRPGRRTRTAERGSALMTVRSLERADVGLLVVDAGEGITDQDARVASLVRERGCAAAILANKWDLVEGARGPDVLAEIRHGLRFVADCPILTVSAKAGTRVDRLLPLAAQLAEAGQRRVGTAELNRWLQDAVRRHEPSMARRGRGRRPIKFFYATQTGVRPPTFVLFCTEPAAVRPAYRRFLENQLRETFGFEGTPLRLRLRARSEKKG